VPCAKGESREGCSRAPAFPRLKISPWPSQPCLCSRRGGRGGQGTTGQLSPAPRLQDPPGTWRDLCSLSIGSSDRIFRSGLRFRTEGVWFSARFPKMLIKDPAATARALPSLLQPWLAREVPIGPASPVVCPQPRGMPSALLFSPCAPAQTLMLRLSLLQPSRRLCGTASRRSGSSTLSNQLLTGCLRVTPGCWSAWLLRAELGLRGCFLSWRWESCFLACAISQAVAAAGGEGTWGRARRWLGTRVPSRFISFLQGLKPPPYPWLGRLSWAVPREGGRLWA